MINNIQSKLTHKSDNDTIFAMKEPKVIIYSFIYNSSQYFEQLFMSVQNVNYSNYEWLIIDDGSNDNLSELVQRAKIEANFPIYYYKKKNEGKLLGYKYLLDLLDNYEYAFCLDADDEIMPDAIKIGVETFIKLNNDSYWCVVGRLVDYKNNTLVGGILPNNINELTKKKQLEAIINIKADLCGLQRVSALKQLTFPDDIPSEIHLAGEGLLWGQLNSKYKQYYINDYFLKYHYIANSNSHEKINEKGIKREIFASAYQINNFRIYHNIFRNMIRYTVFRFFLPRKKIKNANYKIHGFIQKICYSITYIPSWIYYLIYKRRKLKD
jgi:glycosyltransferase involved in cell wall biosynthesis